MRFFFYGTLTPGLAPPGIAPTLRRGRLVARGRLRGRMFAGDGYPLGVFDSRSTSTISGGVFEFPDDPALLRELDDYEGIDPEDSESGLFVREEVSVEFDDGRTLTCWAYRYNRDPGACSPIPHGDFRRWLEESGRLPGG